MKKHKKLSGDFFDNIAKQNGVTTDEVKRELQATIDATWNSTEPAERARQRQLFPKGKPSIEEFITVMAREVKKQ